MPHSKVLLHQGSAGIGGSAMDIAIQADDLRHTRDTILTLVAQGTGQDLTPSSATRAATGGSTRRPPSTTASSTISSPMPTRCCPWPAARSTWGDGHEHLHHPVRHDPYQPG